MLDDDSLPSGRTDGVLPDDDRVLLLRVLLRGRTHNLDMLNLTRWQDDLRHLRRVHLLVLGIGNIMVTQGVI